MKKFLTILLCGFMVIGLTACGSDGSDSVDTIDPDQMTVNGMPLENIMYTDNSSGELPIIATSITYGETTYVGFTDVTASIENTTDTDYKEVVFALIAWDENGLPLKLDEVNYTSYCSCENLAANDYGDLTWQFGSAPDIGYMAFFLSEYTDFDGNTWTNPVIEKISEIEGNRLDDTPISYFTFE